jgi:hypothetical protein
MRRETIIIIMMVDIGFRISFIAPTFLLYRLGLRESRKMRKETIIIIMMVDIGLRISFIPPTVYCTD